VYDRQDKVAYMKGIAEDNLVKAHLDVKKLIEAGAKDDELKEIRKLIRSAQWRWDWVAAANSMGFHAPIEALRVLGTSIDRSKEARLLASRLLSKYNVKQPIDMPDISTKEKAQKYVGLDMDKIIAEKEEFKRVVLPGWIKKNN